MDSKKITLKYGLILGGAVSIYSAILNQIGMGTDQTVASIAYLFIPIVLFFAMKEKRALLGHLSFGQGFGMGALVSLLGSIIISVFIYVYFTFLNPDIIQVIIETTETNLYSRGMDDDQVEQILEMQKPFFTPGWMSFFSLLIYTIVGVIFSLIVALVVKQPQSPEQLDGQSQY